MVKMRNLNPSVAFVFVVVMTGFKSAQSTRVLRHKQNAVFSLVGSENFYVEMKKKIPVTYVDDGQLGHLRDYDYSHGNDINYEQYKNSDQLSTQPRETEYGQWIIDLDDKSTICSFIFDSPFFEARGEVAVNYDLTQTETINELRESKRDTYNDIYGGNPNARGQWMNPYAYVDYFVSPIYLSKRPKDLVMNGRFVFTSNEDNELILIATAEERIGNVIESLIHNIIQRYYYFKNAKLFRKPDKASNVLCTLTVRDKIRLCDSVINLPNFPDDVSFVPDEANVDKCKEIRVSGEFEERKVVPRIFRKPKDKMVTVAITYDQWMLGCKVVGTKSNSRSLNSWYYISPGMYTDWVEVFRESATKHVYSSLVCVTEIFWAERTYDDVRISSKVLEKK